MKFTRKPQIPLKGFGSVLWGRRRTSRPVPVRLVCIRVRSGSTFGRFIWALVWLWKLPFQPGLHVSKHFESPVLADWHSNPGFSLHLLWCSAAASASEMLFGVQALLLLPQNSGHPVQTGFETQASLLTWWRLWLVLGRPDNIAQHACTTYSRIRSVHLPLHLRHQAWDS